MEQKNKRCVVFDTNIWVYETRLLRSPMGASTLFYISTNDIMIGLPEVVEQEVHKHVLKNVNEARENIEDGFKSISIFVGESDDYRLPTQEQIRDSVNQRFETLERLLVRVPFTFEHAREALNKIMNEVPPNGFKDQQFKDSCIWEAVVELSKDYEVHFVTQDKGFFENRNPKKGLAKMLKQEILDSQACITVHENLESFLTTVRSVTPGIDMDNINEQIAMYFTSNFKTDDAVVRDIKIVQSTPFVTHDLNILSLSFKVELNAEIRSKENGELFPGIIVAEGQCSYNTEQHQIADIQLKEINYNRLDGTREHGIVYGYGVIAIGRGMKKFILHEPLQVE